VTTITVEVHPGDPAPDGSRQESVTVVTVNGQVAAELRTTEGFEYEVLEVGPYFRSRRFQAEGYDV
jgi:hypothetical protein